MSTCFLSSMNISPWSQSFAYAYKFCKFIGNPYTFCFSSSNMTTFPWVFALCFGFWWSHFKQGIIYTCCYSIFISFFDSRFCESKGVFRFCSSQLCILINPLACWSLYGPSSNLEYIYIIPSSILSCLCDYNLCHMYIHISCSCHIPTSFLIPYICMLVALI